MNRMNNKNISEIELISRPVSKSRWIPNFLRKQLSWKIYSGTWKNRTSNSFEYINAPKITTGENISIIGSNKWDNYKLQMRFKLLTTSIKPPEGGVIIYYLFKNIRNYYSIHFCVSKQRIELIKRIQGVWNTIDKNNFDLKTHQDYWINIDNNSGMHSCNIDGVTYFRKKDTDLSQGCIGIGTKYCDTEFANIKILLTNQNKN